MLRNSVWDKENRLPAESYINPEFKKNLHLIEHWFFHRKRTNERTKNSLRKSASVFHTLRFCPPVVRILSLFTSLFAPPQGKNRGQNPNSRHGKAAFHQNRDKTRTTKTPQNVAEHDPWAVLSGEVESPKCRSYIMSWSDKTFLTPQSTAFQFPYFNSKV